MTLDEFKDDYDWQSAFIEAIEGDYRYASDENPSPVRAVEEILACAAGENDGDDWLAVVRMGEPWNKYAVVRAGCDYTGWDCQAGGSADFYDDANAACSAMALTPQERERLREPLVALESQGKVKLLDWETSK